MTDTHFVNPIAEGADPAVVRHGASYLWCQSEGNVAVAIWVSDRPTTLGTKNVVWQAPAQGPYSQEVWAPKLFHFDDRWYVYFTASNGNSKQHLAYVLESGSDDPLSDYTLHGPLQTGPTCESGSPNLWAIDMTVLPHSGARYAIWSGWPSEDVDRQDLYIAPLTTPTRLGADRRMLLEVGDYLWEHIDESADSRALAEGPQVVQRGDRTFVLYSCAASWLPTYKLGMLEMVGDDPLDPASWTRAAQPVFQSNEATYGVGHSTFTTSPDSREWWHIYHAKQDRDPGWRRALYAQPIRWRADGTPDFGQPVQAAAPVPLPSGTPGQPFRTARRWRFATDGQTDFDYYGHHQFFAAERDGIHLGIHPASPVNTFRTGEKVVLRDGDYRDFRAVVDFEVRDGDRDAGLLFRASRPAVGYDAVRGYFAGLLTGRNVVILGSMDGRGWREVASAPVFLDPDGPQQITVTAAGPAIKVYVGNDPLPAISVHDTDHDRGSIGCRVVDTHAVFTSLSVTPS